MAFDSTTVYPLRGRDTESVFVARENSADKKILTEN